MKKRSFIFDYLAKYKYKYLFGIITLLIVDIFNLFIPQLTGEITDKLQNHTLTMEGALIICGEILIVAVVLGLGRFLWRYFIFGSAKAIECEIRNDMFKHLETLSMEYFNGHKTGDLMAHFTSDTNAIRMSIGPAVICAFDASVMMILVLVKMIIYIDLKLTILAIIPLSIIAFGSIAYGRQSKIRFYAKQEAFSSLTDQVQESLSGTRVIKAFVQEDAELKAFSKANDYNRQKTIDVVKLQAIVIPLLDIVTGLSSLITLVYGGYLAITGQISLGKFIAFNQYIAMLVWPMLASGESVTMISQGMASARRIQNILDEQATVVNSPEAADIDHIEGDILIKDLTFTYPESDEPVLKNINIHIEKGSTLAILGRTGSGKTTIANLLLHLYNTEDNTIFIDGNDINKITLESLRKQIAYVPQDNFLFSDTLKGNIAFGVDEYTDKDVTDAAKLACIHDNIINFPAGYDTEVGERGVSLSGGQKQRSSIARALMKNASILILDDALSAVDTNTEESILANLKTNRENKTTIIIAHRISTIQNADHILVLDDGHPAEYGTHDSLLLEDGIYANMYRKQQLEKQLEGEA